MVSHSAPYMNVKKKMPTAFWVHDLDIVKGKEGDWQLWVQCVEYSIFLNQRVRNVNFDHISRFFSCSFCYLLDMRSE